MITCLKLDFLLLKPYLKSIVLVLLVPLIFPFVTITLFEGLSFAATILAMTTAYTFSISEKNSLERFYGFLPVKRNNLVGGRYLTIYGIGLFSILVEAGIQVLILTFVKSVALQPADIIGTILICLLLFSIYAGVQIPGYYKYGSIKGKIFMFLPTVGFLLFYYMFHLLSKNGNIEQNLAFLSNPVLFIAGTVLLIGVILCISMSISNRIVKNKTE